MPKQLFEHPLARAAEPVPMPMYPSRFPQLLVGSIIASAKRPMILSIIINKPASIYRFDKVDPQYLCGQRQTVLRNNLGCFRPHAKIKS